MLIYAAGTSFGSLYNGLSLFFFLPSVFMINLILERLQFVSTSVIRSTYMP